MTRILLLLFALAFCFNFLRHISDVRYGYFSDLRNRVVGARLMKEKISPYYFKWNPSYPVTLFDPADISNIKNNLITSPPSLLWLMQPIATLNYTTICYLWVGIHYLFFLLLLLPMYAYARTATQKSFVLTSAMLLLFSDHWRDSVLRGQSHFIFPAVVANILIIVSEPGKWRYFWGGLLFALLVWIRPNAVLIFPFLLLSIETDRRQLLTGFLTGALVFALITIVFKQESYWLDFYHSCREWINNRVSGIQFSKDGWPGVDREKAVIHDHLLKPRSEIGDIYNLVKFKLHVDIKPIYLISAFCLVYLTAFFLSWKKQTRFFSEALLTGILLYWFGEMTTPVLKMSYYYVELFFVVLFLASEFKALQVLEKALLALSFLFTFLYFFPMNLFIAELLLIACLSCYLFRMKFGSGKVTPL
ncbi:MAG TPA: glycosyltransferase 87 family protein [Puia sp.]|nr:glycosyltransferase 87 family protein [Puia sp.]